MKNVVSLIRALSMTDDSPRNRLATVAALHALADEIEKDYNDERAADKAARDKFLADQAAANAVKASQPPAAVGEAGAATNVVT